VCNKDIIPDGIGTGYGTDKNGNKICYACIADIDKKDMTESERQVLYYDGMNITNWPGSLKIRVLSKRKGKHNFAETRTDVWFAFNGHLWHGTQYGNLSQLCYCKQLKQTV